MRGGMYWSGDLAYRDADGFVYFAGRTRGLAPVDGRTSPPPPIERDPAAAPGRVGGGGVRRPGPVGRRPGDGGGGRAGRSRPGRALRPSSRASPTSPQFWPRFVRVVGTLPRTATNKVLARARRRGRAVAGDGVLWTRAERGTS